VTVNCTGPGGSASADATLSTLSALPVASVKVFATPSYLMQPNWVSVTYTAQNVTSCQGGGRYFVVQSTLFAVDCTSPGGNVVGFAWAKMYSPWPFANFAPMASASKDGKTASATATKARAPMNLKHLGIDLSKKRYEFAEIDMNKDGVQDALVIDKLKSQAHIVLGKAGQYATIGKTIDKISTISQIKAVFVPTSNAPGAIRVTAESEQ
jgi:hypothetical protein